jgi:two-component system sensor histidine kinase PilS (NtrC family)
VDILVDESLDQASWEWDRNQLHQVILNLLLNALQAVQNKADSKVMIFWEQKDNEERLVIKDNGPGISPEHKQKIFDPFFTTKKEGTGLGLAVAQRLAGLNGSFIDLESDETEGTRVCLVRIR